MIYYEEYMIDVIYHVMSYVIHTITYIIYICYMIYMLYIICKKHIANLLFC